MGWYTKKPQPGLWSPEEDARLAELVAEGVPISRAAQRLGRTRNSALGRWRRRFAQA